MINGKKKSFFLYSLTDGQKRYKKKQFHQKNGTVPAKTGRTTTPINPTKNLHSEKRDFPN